MAGWKLADWWIVIALSAFLLLTLALCIAPLF
jgi:hypothetical protein